MEWRRVEKAGEGDAGTRAQADALRLFATAYPDTPARLAHDLCGHPLLDRQALAAAAARLEPQHVELRDADCGVGGPFAPATGSHGGADAVESAAQAGGQWAMLNRLESLPEYRALLAETLAPFRPAIEAATGPMLDLRAFVFLSGEGTTVPLHCDAEYNILFQIEGAKRFSTLPRHAPYLGPEALERMHVGGDNMLAWDEAFRAAAEGHALAPGDALFVPYCQPHFVEVTDGPSLSLSLTWKSGWSLDSAEGHRFNALCRAHRLPLVPVAAWPVRTRWRSLAARALRRCGVGG